MSAADDFFLEEPPRLRLIEVVPMGSGRERRILLRDTADPDLSPIVLSVTAIEILRELDGQASIADIAGRLKRRRLPLSEAEVRAFLEQLDQAGYLEGPRARRRLAGRKAAFAAQPMRPARFAGDDNTGAYPESVGQLMPFLAAGYQHSDGPGTLPGSHDPEMPTPAGLIAPHIDLHRGKQTYSWAYKALSEAQPAELYVVLGTCHRPVDGHFAASSKPYDTPLGPVPTDRAFLDRLGQLWGHNLFQGEFSHAAEHSIEFQALYLRSLGVAGEGLAPMVAILCDSLHSMVLPPHSPRDVALVADFVAALRQAIEQDGRRTTVIAAVDLAHVGPYFGDSWNADAQNMERVGRHDREMLDFIMAGDAEGYFRQVMRDNDARRICGFTPIYLLTELMRQWGRTGDLLRYTQYVAPDLSQSVTFTSAIFR